MNFGPVNISFSQGARPSDREAVNQYISNLSEAGFPPILSVDHMSMMVRIRPERLYAISNDQKSFYRQFKIRKRSGGVRTISAPLPLLLYIQRWVLTEILYKLTCDDAAKAYVCGNSIKSNARLHRAQNLVYKTDIKNFFESISEYQISGIFKRIGYSKNVSIFLAKVCCLDGHLPQGAATSGCLSNLVLKDFDASLMRYCSRNKLRYSRYADDVTISGKVIKFDSLNSLVDKEFSNIGLKRHLGKTALRGQHVRQEVTGIVVNEKLSAGRDYLRNLRQEFYYIRKFGLLGHARKIDDNNPRILLESIIGKHAYALFIDPKNLELKNQKKALLKIRREEYGY